MNYLLNCNTAEEAIIAIVTNAGNLCMDIEDILEKYVEGVTLDRAIASDLCGAANRDVAARVMMGDHGALKPFLSNVAYNSNNSAPLILYVLSKYVVAQKTIKKVTF